MLDQIGNTNNITLNETVLNMADCQFCNRCDSPDQFAKHNDLTTGLGSLGRLLLHVLAAHNGQKYTKATIFCIFNQNHLYFVVCKLFCKKRYPACMTMVPTTVKPVLSGHLRIDKT